jgi:hypothetical protein
MRSAHHSFPNHPCECEVMLYNRLPMNRADNLPQLPAAHRRSFGLAHAAVAHITAQPTHRTHDPL